MGKNSNGGGKPKAQPTRAPKPKPEPAPASSPTASGATEGGDGGAGQGPVPLLRPLANCACGGEVEVLSRLPDQRLDGRIICRTRVRCTACEQCKVDRQEQAEASGG